VFVFCVVCFVIFLFFIFCGNSWIHVLYAFDFGLLE